MHPWTLFAIGAGFVLFVIYPLYINDRLWGSRGKSLPRTLLKGLGALIAALMALYGAVINSDPASMLIAIGLFAGALADIVLDIHFTGGMSAFLLGHILYLSAFMKLVPLHMVSIVISVVLLALILYLFRKEFSGMGLGAVPYILYSAIILFMMSVAALLPWRIGIRGGVAAVGALLFVFSDMLLAKKILSPRSSGAHATTIMGLYYSGQLLLSMTAMMS